MKQLVLLTCMMLVAVVTGFGQKMDTVEQKAIQTLLNSRKATIEYINEPRRDMDAEVDRKSDHHLFSPVISSFPAQGGMGKFPLFDVGTSKNVA